MKLYEVNFNNILLYMKHISIKFKKSLKRAGAGAEANAAPVTAQNNNDITMSNLAWFGRITALITLIFATIFGSGLILIGVLLIISCYVKMNFLNSPVLVKIFNIQTNSPDPLKLNNLDPTIKTTMGIFYIVVGLLSIIGPLTWYYFATINTTTGAIAGVVDGVDMGANVIDFGINGIQ